MPTRSRPMIICKNSLPNYKIENCHVIGMAKWQCKNVLLKVRNTQKTSLFTVTWKCHYHLTSRYSTQLQKIKSVVTVLTAVHRIGGPWFKHRASKKYCTSEQSTLFCVADIAASTTEGVSIGRTRAEINGLVIT